MKATCFLTLLAAWAIVPVAAAPLLPGAVTQHCCVTMPSLLGLMLGLLFSMVPGRARSRSRQRFVAQDDFSSSTSSEEDAWQPDLDMAFIKMLPASLPRQVHLDFVAMPGQLHKVFGERPKMVQVVNYPFCVFVEKPEAEDFQAFKERLCTSLWKVGVKTPHHGVHRSYGPVEVSDGELGGVVSLGVLLLEGLCARPFDVQGHRLHS